MEWFTTADTRCRAEDASYLRCPRVASCHDGHAARADGPWFNPVAEFLGEAYLRNAFTKGTVQEIDFLVDALDLRPGARVLDAGCGPGRHALELARRGIAVTGVDLSPDFVARARAAAAPQLRSPRRRDAKRLHRGS